MNLLAVELAIFQRLVGAPLDGQGNPKLGNDGLPVNRLIIGPPDSPTNRTRLPSYGIRVPMIGQGRDSQGHKSSSSRALHPFDDFATRNFRQVPVFPINFEGKSYESQWPCVTYYFAGMEERKETFIYHDPIGREVGEASITNRNGDVIATGADEIEYRKHPDSDDLLYVIKFKSKDHAEISWITECIRYLFPNRGALEVLAMDGTTVPLDMFRESFEMSNSGDVHETSGGRGQRDFERVFTYRVEGYVDNTVNSYGYNDIFSEQTIRERILELANIQNQLLESTDVNQQVVPAQQ